MQESQLKESHMKTKGLFIRADKIGDLVLSLPADSVAREIFGHETQWMISNGTQFVMDHAVEQRPVFLIQKKFSIRQCLQVIQWLKMQNFDYSVTLFAPWWIQLCLFLARVPIRTGRASQWHSFLFLNFPIRQSRKTGNIHETWSGYLLWLEGLRRAGFDFSLHHKALPGTLSEFKFHRIKAESLDDEGTQNLPKEYVVIHAGMAGSALNWPHDHYVELAKRLLTQTAVVFTGTDMDLRYLEPIRTRLEHLELFSHPNLFWKLGQLSTASLLAVLARAKCVVAPSTGVLHLAASLGVKTIGLYSPIPVQRATRWGARGPRVYCLQAEFTDENQKKNLNEPAIQEQIMGQIRVDTVLEIINSDISLKQ